MKTDGKNLLLNTEMNFPESADKDRHLMRYTLLQEKNHHMAFLSQFWPLSDHSGLGGVSRAETATAARAKASLFRILCQAGGGDGD